jgi:SAM-dependent methyltransferase
MKSSHILCVAAADNIDADKSAITNVRGSQMQSPSLCQGHHTALELLSACCDTNALVVDAGAFPGGFTRALRGHGWRVVALDKEPDRAVSLQDRFNAGEQFDYRSLRSEATFAEVMSDIGVEVRAVDLEQGPFPLESDSADAVVLTEVIEHLWVDPLCALSEANRVLKRDGVLLISTPNLLSLRNRFNLLFGRMGRVIEHPFLAYLQKRRIGHVGHVRLYAPEELGGTLDVLGFRCEFSFHTFGYWDPVPGCGPSDGGTTPLAPRRSLIQRLMKPPRQYAQALVATVRTWLEQAIPQFRSHMFIVARKVSTVDLETLSLKSVERQLHARECAPAIGERGCRAVRPLGVVARSGQRP